MSSARILIVEDEGVVALDIQHHLTKLGYQVVGIAPSGEEAVRLASATEPDVILMDIRLRGAMDGIEAAEQIQAQAAIPLIYLTAHTDTGTLARAKLTAPFGYIVKPFNEQELQTAIEIALYRHELEQRVHTYAAQLEQEIAERKRVEAELRASEARYRLLVETSPDGIVMIGLDGRLIAANQPIASLLRFESVEAMMAADFNVFDMIAPQDRARATRDLQANLSQGQLRDLEYTILRTNGTEVPVDVSVSVALAPDGTPTALIGVVRDITIRKKAEQDAAALVAERERLNAMRQFLGHASHDLRTPLTTMKTSLYLLERLSEAASVDLQRHVITLIKQATYLERLLEDMLTMVRLDTTDTLTLVLADLNRLVDEVVTRFRVLTEEKGCDLKFFPVTDTLRVQADEYYLAHAIVRLLQNAIQFTPEQGVIEVCTRATDGQVVVEVRDSGPGIEPQHLPHIFSSFYRADTARGTEQGGMGLGLAIAKRIVEFHSGAIVVDSELGQGSVFSICIPASTTYDR